MGKNKQRKSNISKGTTTDYKCYYINESAELETTWFRYNPTMELLIINGVKVTTANCIAYFKLFCDIIRSKQIREINNPLSVNFKRENATRTENTKKLVEALKKYTVEHNELTEEAAQCIERDGNLTAYFLKNIANTITSNNCTECLQSFDELINRKYDRLTPNAFGIKLNGGAEALMKYRGDLSKLEDFYNEDVYKRIEAANNEKVKEKIQKEYSDNIADLNEIVSNYASMNNMCFMINAKDYIRVAEEKQDHLNKFDFDFNVIINRPEGLVPLIISVRRAYNKMVITSGKDIANKLVDNYTSVKILFNESTQDKTEIVEFISLDNGMSFAVDRAWDSNHITLNKKVWDSLKGEKATTYKLRPTKQDFSVIFVYRSALKSNMCRAIEGGRLDYPGTCLSKENVFAVVNAVYEAYSKRNQASKYKSRKINSISESVLVETATSKDLTEKKFVTISNIKEARRNKEVIEIHTTSHSHHASPRMHYRRKHTRGVYDKNTGKLIRTIEVEGTWVNKDKLEPCNYNIKI